MKRGCKLLAMICFGLFLSEWGQAQQNEEMDKAIDPKDVRVVQAHALDYPLSAHSAQGLVVVRIKLNEEGMVVTAEAISGDEALIPKTLLSVKTWRFQPNTTRTAIIVFHFRKAQGRCKSASSYFSFDPPIMATIEGCWPETASSNVANTAEDSHPDTQVLTGDRELEIIDYQEMKYPVLARRAQISGIVILQIRLNEDGSVEEASPIYGNALLTRYCIQNARKWRFRPNKKRITTIIYQFIISGGIALEDQEITILYPPNLMRVETSRIPVVINE